MCIIILKNTIMYYEYENKLKYKYDNN